MKLFFLIALLFSIYSATAQDTTNTNSGNQDFFTYLESDIYPGKVQINQDNVLREMINKHIEVSSKMNSCPGYRIRIFSDSGQSARDNANKTKSKFLTLYPDVESYVEYDQPNFKVLVGDFRTKSEALKFLKQISDEFTSAFIIKDQIAFPPIE